MPTEHNNVKHNKVSPKVKQWHLFFEGNKQLSNRM